MKKLFLISQNVNTGYDTYSDAVVCAENEEQAKKINPGGFYVEKEGVWFFRFIDGTTKEQDDNSWCLPGQVKVQEIGTANNEIGLDTVICASFHAG